MRITPLEIPSLSPNLEHTPNARSSKKTCRNFIDNMIKLILKNRDYKKFATMIKVTSTQI